MTRTRSWHFLGPDRRLGYDDGREITPGCVVTCDDEPVLCHSGLHASIRPLDALNYAPGPVVCRVDVGGVVVRGPDKIAGSTRTVIWMADATSVLRRFARACALDVIGLWDPPPVVVEYLRRGDGQAREEARAAANAAFWAASSAAGWAAGWAASRSSGWAVANVATTAATAATWAAAYSTTAASKKQNRRLHGMLMKLPREVG